MKAILRSAIVAAGAAATLTVGMTPASAAGIVEFHGEAVVNCFGCGPSSGSASLSVTGVIGTTVAVQTPATASYDVFEEDADPQCVVSGTANGSVSGAGFSVDFNWTRVGAVAVISTTGDINGAGVAAFAVTEPHGVPCSQRVVATVAGAVAGV